MMELGTWYYEGGACPVAEVLEGVVNAAGNNEMNGELLLSYECSR